MSNQIAREVPVPKKGTHDTALRQLSILIELQRPMTLPRFRSSMLRGVLGHGLRRLACDCGRASEHSHNCLYGRIFEPRSEKPGMYTPPPPVILSSPWVESDETPVDQFRMKLTLMGVAHDHALLVLKALQTGLNMGLGEARIPASIRSADASDKPETERQVTALEFFSPVLLKRKQPGHKVSTALAPESIDHREILFALNRRIQQLREAYQIPPKPLSRDLLETACESAHSVNRLYPAKLCRFSNRQRRQMVFDGVLGQIKLRDVPDFALPLLHWGQWFHVGGKTALGMGCYRVVLAPRPEVFPPVPVTFPGGDRK